MTAVGIAVVFAGGLVAALATGLGALPLLLVRRSALSLRGGANAVASLVLVPRGARLRTAAAWSIATALPEPLVAVPAFAVVEASASILPLVLGLAAGAMATVVVAELLPEACVHARRRVVFTATTAALAAATALQLVLA